MTYLLEIHKPPPLRGTPSRSAEGRFKLEELRGGASYLCIYPFSTHVQEAAVYGSPSKLEGVAKGRGRVSFWVDN